MKYLFFFFPFFVFSALHAENNIPTDTTVQINGITYSYESAGRKMFIENTAFTLCNQPPNLPDENCFLGRRNPPIIRAKVLEVFSPQRYAQLKQMKETICVLFYIKPSTGETLGVRFFTANPCMFTYQEIYELETRFKTLIFPQDAICHTSLYVKFEAFLIY